MKKEVVSKLNELLKKHGELRTSMVLEEAKKKRSPLHNEFEWDDTKAAHNHRLWQSRQLIKRFSVTIVEHDEKLINVPSVIRKEEGTYKPAKYIVKSLTEFERAMNRALQNLSAAKEAVTILSNVANNQEDNTASLLALALQGVEDATNAISRIN